MPTNDTTPETYAPDKIPNGKSPHVLVSDSARAQAQPANSEANWPSNLNRAIDECGALTQGWDGYEAPPPSVTAMVHAKLIVESCYRGSYQPRTILPSVEGGIAVLFDTPTKYADIECLNTGEILAVTSDTAKEPDVWTVSKNAIEATLERIRGFVGRQYS